MQNAILNRFLKISLVPVVHDELDPVPEGERVARVDDEPHDPWRRVDR